MHSIEITTGQLQRELLKLKSEYESLKKDFQNDITERMLVEEALRESEEKYKLMAEQFEAILDHIPGLVFYKDKHNNFIRVNKYLANAYNKNKEELEGVNISDIYPKEDAEKYYQDDLSVINSGLAKLNFEEHWETDEGLKWVNTSKIPFVDSDKNIIGIIGISMDITKRKLAEHEIHKKNLELNELSQTKDKFFSIIAHDLKSPLAGFLGLTKIIAEDYRNLNMSEIQDFSKKMQESAANLYKLLENLLEWSRMQRGMINYNPDICILHYIVNHNIDLINESAGQKDIQLINKVKPDIKVKADIPMLNTIFRNLISNAVKFTPRGGTVEIGVINNKAECSNLSEGFLELYIKDSGIGISSEIIDKLFKIDHKISRPGTEGEPSTGLGLLLCKDFVEIHGGKIWVESEEDKGSTFYFTLSKT